MADPLSITLAAITLGTALKDLTEMALKLHGSFKKHAHNMRAAESLAADTLEIVQDIKNFYISRGDVLNNLPDVHDAVARLSKDMQSVYDQCLPNLQLANTPGRGLRRTLFKIELWRNRKEVESNIRNLREQANKCYRRFTRHTQLGTAVAIGELRGAVSEVSTTARQLFALQISDENVHAFMGSTCAVLSTLPPGVMLSEDLVFKLYIRNHVAKIDDILKNLASKQSCTLERPNDRHTRPLTICSPLSPQTPGAIEYVRGSTIAELVRLQQDLLNAKEGGTPKQEVAWTLTSLAVDLYRLRMHSESLILCTWSVDLYRTLSIWDRNAYAPRLVLALFNLALMSYRTGDFAQANLTRTECLSVLKTCAPPFATETITARALTESAYFRRAIGEHSSASLQDAEASVAMWERLGANQMVVIGPQQGGNHATFGLQLTGGDQAIHDYAYALDAQRVFLYDSKRYQEAVDVGRKALRLYRGLARYYKHIEIQSKVAILYLFLCRDVFRDAIPLSSALIYAQEAMQIWEEIRRSTGAEEKGILDSLALQAKILVEMGRPSDALTTFQKLARRVRSMAMNQRMYIHTLQDLASSLFYDMHYAEAATASGIIVKICRQSAYSLPTSQRSLIDILLDHIKYCAYANYLSEALVSSNELLAIAGQQRTEDATFTEQYLDCLDWAASLSIEAGYPQEAVSLIQDALNVLGPTIQNHFGCDIEMLDVISLITFKALAFLRLGRLDRAATSITEAYSFAEPTTLNLQEGDTFYAELLHVSALVHRCCGKQDDALSTVTAAISIFVSCGWHDRLHTLSDVQADMGYDAEALRTAEEAVQSTEKYTPPSLPWANHSHKMPQYSLCLRLFFSGDFTRARQLILEVRRFYEWHVHSRNTWFINLARALRAEGILECASDRHAEGAAARARLHELQESLRSTLPGVADQVHVDLNYERNYPAWRHLLEKYPLTCSHWVEDDTITG